MEVQSQFIEMFGNPLSQVQKHPLKRLGECCELNPRRPSIAMSDTEMVSFVPMPCVSENGYLQDVADEEYGKVKKGFTYFENKDVLFAKITPCMENGKGAIAQELTNNIGMGSTEFHVLRPIEGVSNSYWLLALTRMPIFRERASKNMSGTGGQKRVSAPFLDNFMVGLPPIEEQNRFEEIYKQADKSKFVGFKSQFIEMLSHSGYEEKSLGELCDKITDGSHNPPKGNDGSEYLMISSKNIFIDGLDLADVRHLSKEEFDLENKRTEVKKNDILLTIVGTIGRTYLVKGNEGNIVMQRSVAVLKPSDKVNPLFMMYSLHTDENLEKEGRGNAQKGVYLKQLSQFKIKVPSLDVQERFCTIYQQADKSKYYNQVA